MRHSQTRGENRERKARPEAPDGRGGYKRSEIPTEAVPVGIGARYSGTGKSKGPRIATGRAATPVGSKRPDRRERPRAVWQLDERRAGQYMAESGQVRNAKDPAPASRRPARRLKTLGSSSPVNGDDHTGKRLQENHTAVSASGRGRAKADTFDSTRSKRARGRGEGSSLSWVSLVASRLGV